ncbi:MAG: hypothetical protein Q8R85_14580 [Bosea sp. (in: a-proteobacteria)]|uniref:hypothetical protein n=1 Tax=Bosea sp. (in: a-proteobacteria) TaxID=1871050 RepID=UPI002732901D|nr:hypothetical protein [Bosea sp. (in: a-proteobacteria)]MDP3602382.1 hypothetical protein [Bosea sp. (in: a-proteobacteria)]
MNDKNHDLTGPHEGGEIDRPDVRTDLDPIAIVTELVSDDPSVAELVAFRSAIPDLKFVAREAKRLADEALRVRFAAGFDAVPQIAVGLTLVSLSFTALVAVWPSDNLDVAEAKLALSEATGPYGDSQDGDYVPALSAETAARIRVKRAAFSVGELMLPPAPAAPSAQDRGLGDWPMRHYDLTTILPPAGGPAVYVDPNAQRWVALLTNAPDLSRLADRVERLIKIADRLFALARTPGNNATELRRAAEGAQILAYLTAAQVAIWPAVRGSAGVQAKKRVVRAIDDRACRGDPLAMQAAVRMVFEDASWLAKLVDGDRMATGIPDWIEIV